MDIQIDTKLIQASVALTDPQHIYNPDIEAAISDILRQRYVGSCFQQCLITDIIAITKRSTFTANRQRQDGSMCGDVQFKVKCVTAHPGAVLHACVVNAIDPDGHVICGNDIAAIYIKASSATQRIRAGAIIPVIVANCHYGVGRAKISVNGRVFTRANFAEPNVIYSVAPGTRPSEAAVHLLGEMKVAAAAYEDAYPAPVREFFERLIAAAAAPGEAMSLHEFIAAISRPAASQKPMRVSFGAAARGDFVSIRAAAAPGEDILSSAALQLAAPGGIAVKESAERIALLAIDCHRRRLAALGGLCRVYGTMDEIKRNSYLWDIFRGA